MIFECMFYFSIKDITYFTNKAKYIFLNQSDNFSLTMATKRSNKDREEHGDKRVKVTAPQEAVEGI